MTPISSPATSAAATNGPTEAEVLKEFKSAMGERLMMNFQQSSQALTKSMTQMSDKIKASMQDEE